jgi:hypothetical protein
MQTHEPISAFKTPAPEVPAKFFRLSAARKIQISYALTAFSAAVLIVVIAAEVASAG